MEELKQGFERLNYTEVKTYLNSGNVIFSSDEADTIKKSSGAHTLEKRLYVSSLLQVLRRRVHWCASTGQ